MKKSSSTELFLAGFLSVFPIFVEPARAGSGEAVPISFVYYDADRKALFVEYPSKPSSLFIGVPEAEWNALLDAPSKAEYIANHIVGKYPTR